MINHNKAKKIIKYVAYLMTATPTLLESDFFSFRSTLISLFSSIILPPKISILVTSIIYQNSSTHMVYIPEKTWIKSFKYIRGYLGFVNDGIYQTQDVIFIFYVL